MQQTMDKKEVDTNGYWYIYDNPITRVGVFPYLGRQISNDLDPDKIYQVLRPEEELTRPETLESFKLKPLINEHEMLGKEFTPAEEKGVHGTLGENVKYDKDKGIVTNNLIIYSEAMKNAIENGKKELSLGYKCSYDLTPGEYNGQHYDAVQRDILLNHIALVDEGRMGHDVRVMDKAITTFDTFSEVLKIQQEEKKQMKKHAYDEDVNIEINQAGEGEEAVEEQTTPPVADEDDVCGEDADEDKRKLIDEIGGILNGKIDEELLRTVLQKAEELAYNPSETGSNDEDIEETEEVKTEDDDEDKPACDEDEEKKDDDKPAEDDDDEDKPEEEKSLSMDAAIKYIARRDNLVKRIRPLIGDNSRYSSMNIKQVVKYACDKLDIKPSLERLEGYLQAKSRTVKTVSLDSMFNNNAESSVLRAYKNQK